MGYPQALHSSAGMEQMHPILLDRVENRRTSQLFCGRSSTAQGSARAIMCRAITAYHPRRSHAVDSPRTARASAPRPTVSLLQG